jgi:hypothetical protein
MRAFLLVLGLALLAPPARADEAGKPGGDQYQVPYKLTIPKHIMVRAKINGKGPFNFILDTGAPALFVAEKVAKKLGLEPDRRGWGTIDRFEIEGGVVLAKARARLETPFQLEGMNGLGLAGAELHGIIGYNILAQFRMEIDFTRDKMAWTRLAWKPDPPKGMEGKGGGQGGLEIIGTIMKALGAFLGKKADRETVARGFLGLEAVEDDGVVVVKSVLAGGPAAEAGLKPGDKVRKFAVERRDSSPRSVYGLDELRRFVNKVAPGDTVKVVVERGKDTVDLTVKAGEGF